MKKYGTVFILITQTLLLTLLTLFCVLPFSCRVSEEGIVFVGGDFISPVLEEVNVIDERTVRINFSEAIRIKSFVVSEKVNDISDSPEHSATEELSPALKAAGGGYGKVEADFSSSDDGCIITFLAQDKYEVGQAYEIFGTVEDRAGNTLTFCVPFCGYNSCLPKLVMTEVQPRYKKYKEEYRCEFVEFLALTDGNLSGLELVSGADGDAKKYEFPPVNVKAGQVFVVHLRNAGEGAVSEEEDLNASKAFHSAKNALDIWSANTKARLNDDTDIIVLRNSIDGKLLDAMLYALEDATEWGKGKTELLDQLGEYKIYESLSVLDAELNSGLGSSAQYSFVRNDALRLQEQALSGAFSPDLSEGGAEYPVKRTEETWSVKKVSPGTL